MLAVLVKAPAIPKFELTVTVVPAAESIRLFRVIAPKSSVELAPIFNVEFVVVIVPEEVNVPVE